MSGVRTLPTKLLNEAEYEDEAVLPHNGARCASGSTRIWTAAWLRQRPVSAQIGGTTWRGDQSHSRLPERQTSGIVPTLRNLRQNSSAVTQEQRPASCPLRRHYKAPRPIAVAQEVELELNARGSPLGSPMRHHMFQRAVLRPATPLCPTNHRRSQSASAKRTPATMTPALGSPTLTLPSSFVLSPNAKIREIHIGSVHQLPSGVYDIPTQYPIAETVDDATAMPSLRLDSSMSSAGGEIFAPQVKFTKPAASNKNTRLTSTNSFACDSVKESPATEALVSIGSNEADVATPLQMEISIKTLADVGPYTLRCVSPSASPATALTRIMSGMLKQVSPEKKRQRDRRALDARKRLAAQKETHEAEHAKAEKRRAQLGPFTDEYRRLIEFTRSSVVCIKTPPRRRGPPSVRPARRK
jgi:hypothetical protein